MPCSYYYNLQSILTDCLSCLRGSVAISYLQSSRVPL